MIRPTKNHPKAGTSIDRRRFLRTMAGGGALLLAGCSGDDGSDSAGDDPGDRAFRLTTIYDPQEQQFNWLNPSNSSAIEDLTGTYLYDRLLLYTPATDEYHFDASIIKDWTVDGETLTVTITDEHQWHNGDPVTADDFVAHHKLRKYQYVATGSEHPYYSEVEAVDDTTVEFTLHDAFNETILIQYLFTYPDDRLWTKASVFQEWIDQFENAQDQSEMEEILGEVQREEITDPVGHGPFQFAEASAQGTRLELFEDHPSADQLNFSEINWRAFTDGQAELQAIRAGEVDATTCISPQEESIMQQWPEGLDTPSYKMPDYGGRALRIQHDHDVLGIQEVRQAFAHAISREDIGTNTSPNVEATEIMAEVPEESMDEWLGDLVDDLNEYPHDDERAAELMEEASFSRDGEQWVGEDGQPVEIEIKSAPYADTHVPVAETAGSHLNEFGIDATVRQLDETQWANDVANGNYDLITEGWGSGLPHPYFWLSEVYDGELAQASNIPQEFEVPPVGEPDGSPETVNAVDTVRSIPAASNEEAEELIRQLAWLSNRQVPELSMGVGFCVTWMYRPDRFHYTTEDEGLLTTTYPPLHGARLGFLKATE